jgi:hypothetical protein
VRSRQREALGPLPGLLGASAVIASLALFSWGFWAVWAAIGLAFELFAVRTERKTGALPLTRVVRDRLMRKSTIAKVGMLTFLTWLWVHFVTPLPW